MVVSVGDDVEPYDIAATQPWSDANVAWRWASREEFRKLSYHATVLDRFRVDSDADIVLFADADTLFVKNVDDLLLSLQAVPAVAGVMAHVPPFIPPAAPVDRGETWETLFKKLGQRFPSDLYQLAGWGTAFHRPDLRFSPIYYNFGAVFVPGSLLANLASAYLRQLVTAEKADIGYFVGQMALTLAIYELDLPRISLPIRYNFPNGPAAEASYPQDLADLRILHYLGMDEVRRDIIFQSPEETIAFINRRNLRPSNEALRRTVEKLWTMDGSLFRTRDAASQVLPSPKLGSGSSTSAKRSLSNCR